MLKIDINTNYPFLYPPIDALLLTWVKEVEVDSPCLRRLVLLGRYAPLQWDSGGSALRALAVSPRAARSSTIDALLLSEVKGLTRLARALRALAMDSGGSVLRALPLLPTMLALSLLRLASPYHAESNIHQGGGQF